MTETNRLSPPPRSKHLVGWTVIVSSADAEELRRRVVGSLDAFAGDFGSIRVTEVAGGIGFGFWKPEAALPMTTWSFSRDGRHIAFFEGVFYDDYGSHRIIEGEDPGLARAVAGAVEAEGEAAVARLNGSFAGFLFDLDTRTLRTYVDRLGTRTLYWSQSKNELVVSSNLAAFRGLLEPKLDLQGAFQFLSVGFPIGERTLLEDIFLQPPASVIRFSAGTRTSSRYWTAPARQEDLSLPDAVELIVGSMEDSVARIARRSRGRFGLGLTGGHDSRVIFSSLLHKKVPFEAVSWRDHNFNDRIVPQLCALVQKELHFVAESSPEELRDIQRHTFAYTDGQHLHAYGYSWLGRQCSIEGLDTLILGFSGDMLSGSAIPSQLDIRNVGKLARRMFGEQMELLSFRDAETLLKDSPAAIRAESMSVWMQSFEKETWRGALPDISIWQRLQNRNFKRVGHAMNPSLRYTQVVYPYLDNAVMETYFSLPIRFLDQKPHCYAGFRRFPLFGEFPACGFPISLKNEARFPLGVYLLRLATANVRALRSRTRRAPDRSAWSPADERVYEEVARSPLFDSRRLEELVAKRRIKVIDLRKMQTLSQFDRFYVRGDDSVVPSSYLSRY